MTNICFLILLICASSYSQTITSEEGSERFFDDVKFNDGEIFEKCDDNSEFLIDGAWPSQCDVTCDALFGRETAKICTMGIFPRCVCRPGFIRRSTNGKCVHNLDCNNISKSK